MILQYVNTPMQFARLQKRDIQDIVNKRKNFIKLIEASKLQLQIFIPNIKFFKLFTQHIEIIFKKKFLFRK